MIEVGQLISVFDHLINWLKTAGEGRRQNREEYKKALLIIYMAANETKSYIASLKRRKNPDLERERKLSQLWREASVELREIDRDFAQRCLLKSDYWADPTSWSNEDIDNARISINEVFNRAKELL